MTLFLWNGTNWTLVPGQELNTSANQLNVTNFNAPLGGVRIFGLFANRTNDGGNDESDPSLSVTVDDGTVTVTSGGEPVEDARIYIDGSYAGKTDEDGQLELTDCGDSVEVEARKTGYDKATTSAQLPPCQELECEYDSDCAYNEVCSSNECVSIDCDCGTVQNHECVDYECCSNSQCSTGYSCVSHVCEENEQPECTTDADCALTEYCSNGDCVDVTGSCGYAANHQWIPYECGTEANCPVCPNGLCISHECVSGAVDCEDGTVGSTTDCSATEGNDPCPNCDYTITTPDGQVLTGKTDDNGDFGLPLTLVGTYKISLIKGGAELSSTEVTSSGTDDDDEEKPPVVGGFDAMSFVFLAVILLLIVALVLYYYSTRGKSKK
jgi:hypothetical protein